MTPSTPIIHSHRWFTAIVCTTILALLGSLAAAQEFPVSGLTEAGHYRVTLKPVPEQAPIAEFHDWVLRVETKGGDLFVPSRLGLVGGMPTHGHGMVSEPRVTQQLDDGAFLVEGMKFHMGGEWQLMVGVEGPDGVDTVRFDVSISANPSELGAAINEWSAAEIVVMQSLSLTKLPARTDPSNRFSGNKLAAGLGGELFFDKALSASKTIACATCHDPERAFTDGLPRSFGTAQTARNAPTVIGSGHSQWFYWDGRRDSLWAQAITPLETPGEMDNNRVDVVKTVLQKYPNQYATVVGLAIDPALESMPDGAGPFADAAGKNAWNRMSTADRNKVNAAFSNIGKMLAAYMETLQPVESRFDQFVGTLSQHGYEAAENILTDQEQRGLKLFLDGARTQCMRCHNGPLFTNHGFHNIATGINDEGQLDFGRMIGQQAATLDEFNCRGNYSDTEAENCSDLRFSNAAHASRGAFKVPGLRNVSQTGPYMHDGRFATLAEVLVFYTETPDERAGNHELPPLELNSDEIDSLAAFLFTLSDSPASKVSRLR